jgi:hypothetical protein
MTDTKLSSASPLIAITEQAGKAIAVIAALLLSISVFYDYSFLLAIGLSFRDIPSSLSEHVTSAILWAPPIFVSVFVIFMYEFYLRRAEDGKSQEELIAGSSTQFGRAFRKYGNLAPFVLAPAAVLFAVFLSENLVYVYILVGFLWIFIAPYAINRFRFGKFCPGLIIFVPIIFFVVGAYGDLSGYRMLAAATPKWEMVLRDESTITKQTLLGVRRFGSFTIVVD